MKGGVPTLNELVGIYTSVRHHQRMPPTLVLIAIAHMRRDQVRDQDMGREDLYTDWLDIEIRIKRTKYAGADGSTELDGRAAD